MATTAGREEGPPPGHTSEQRAQADLGAINHPPTHCWKGARRPRLSWATPKGAAEPDARKGRVGGPPGRRSQTPDPRAEGGQPHTRATQPWASQGHRRASHPSWGKDEKVGREQSQIGVRTPPQDRGLRHQSLRPDGNQGCHFHLPGPGCLLAPGASVCWLSRRSLPSSLPAGTQSRVACPQSKAQRQT